MNVTPDLYLSYLGASIRKARHSSDQTQQAVAEAAGISKAFMSDLERGKRDICSRRLVALASALGVTVASLLPLADDSGKSPDWAAEVAGSLEEARLAPECAQRIHALSVALGILARQIRSQR